MHLFKVDMYTFLVFKHDGLGTDFNYSACLFCTRSNGIVTSSLSSYYLIMTIYYLLTGHHLFRRNGCAKSNSLHDFPFDNFYNSNELRWIL